MRTTMAVPTTMAMVLLSAGCASTRPVELHLAAEEKALAKRRAARKNKKKAPAKSPTLRMLPATTFPAADASARASKDRVEKILSDMI